MYANAEIAIALPPVLSRAPGAGPCRRRRIGGLDLEAPRLERFNGLLARLGRPQPMDCDQIATAARCLLATAAAGAAPCIAHRVEQAGTLARMLADGAWTPDDAAEPAARAVVDYLQERDQLIPDWVPQVGRLDDAIVVDVAWPRVSAEVLDYLDFCRLRELEASLRGIEPAGFRFGRGDWEEARRAEAALHDHRRRVRSSAYVPAPVVYFRVH
jgi:uncharacterized membrane protein YkvA (DUF1232 family)